MRPSLGHRAEAVSGCRRVRIQALALAEERPGYGHRTIDKPGGRCQSEAAPQALWFARSTGLFRYSRPSIPTTSRL
jgi:hypothetical protein